MDPIRLLNDILHIFSFEIKLAIAGLTGGVALIADIASETKGLEDLGLKAILIAALIYIGRLYLTQQREHKQEMRDLISVHQSDSDEREHKVTTVMQAMISGLGELTALTREQTEYFRAFTKRIVEEGFNKK